MLIAGALAAIFALVTAANTYLVEVGQNVGASPGSLRAADMLWKTESMELWELISIRGKASNLISLEELVALAARVAGYEVY